MFFRQRRKYEDDPTDCFGSLTTLSHLGKKSNTQLSMGDGTYGTRLRAALGVYPFAPAAAMPTTSSAASGALSATAGLFLPAAPILQSGAL